MDVVVLSIHSVHAQYSASTHSELLLCVCRADVCGHQEPRYDQENVSHYARQSSQGKLMISKTDYYHVSKEIVSGLYCAL